MTRCLVLYSSMAVALAISLPAPAPGEQLARIATHSHRYGAQIEISAYEDPFLRGITCYVSKSHDENALGGTSQPTRAPDAEVSCHQVGKLTASNRVPKQAQVFDESVDPIFRVLHVFRILDASRQSVLYFSYTESELAGDLPGHVDVIQLPVRGR
ncbi:CreA protein [Paraburkholderia sp. JPY465]|uniref:CreA family protein n=1 Tax=Paraburkholderia sp. JPY465 TaxID=3042285 RepID=UPI003D2069D2